MIRLFMIVLACAVAMSGATVKGIVRDSVTGEPLVGAEVIVAAHLSVTGPDGTFEVAKLSPGKRTFHIKLKGYLWNWETDWQRSYLEIAPTDEVKQVTVRLDPVASIAGIVRTETGEPIPKAKVFCWFCSHDFSTDTGFDGRFVLSSVVSGPVTLRAWVPPAVRSTFGVAQQVTYGVELAVATGQTIEGIDIRVPSARLVSVSGTVVDPETGEPVRKGRVELQAFDEARLSWMPEEPLGLERGTFRFDGIAPGSYILQVHQTYAGGPTISAHRIEVGPDGVENYEVKIPAIARLTGKVKHPQCPECELRLWFQQILPGRPLPSGGAPAALVAGGRFVAEGLTPGIWKAQVEWSKKHRTSFWDESPPPLRVASMRQSGRELNGEVEVLAGENPELEIELVPTVPIHGVVVDRSGRAVIQANISISRGPEQFSTLSLDDGAFSWYADGPGTYEFRAHWPAIRNGRKCETDPVVVRLGQASVNGVRLVLCP